MPDWNSFLAAQPLPELVTINAESTYLMPLTQGIISINGPEAAKFLQGQVTCDVRELENNNSLLGAQCNIKGRMLLCFRALQTSPEQILLRVHPGLVASGMTSLGKYIVFSKAKLADASQAYCGLGIAGPAAGNLVQNQFGVALEQDNQWQAAGKHLVIRISAERYECWLDAESAITQWEALRTGVVIANHNLWNLFNIQEGLGDITPETYEQFTPQAINFQLVNGINFRKGCYTGQEIVARLHYRGTLKRHMYRFEFNASDGTLPAPGSELKNAEGKNVGEVVLAAYKTATTGELLASVVDDERIAIYLTNNPQKLSLLALPYAIPTANEAD